jgi:hypothetical protein
VIVWCDAIKHTICSSLHEHNLQPAIAGGGEGCAAWSGRWQSAATGEVLKALLLLGWWVVELARSDAPRR